MAGLQLSYSFFTVPDVLQAGAGAQLTIVVSNAGAAVTVKSIDFTLRDGPTARDIVDGVTPTTRTMPEGWIHSDPSGGKFSMTPSAPVTITRQGLTFTFDLTVNTVVGTAFIDVVEHLEVGGNRGTLSIPKFPQQFRLTGFYSTTPIINQGDSVTLVWTGENLHLANYRLSYSTAGGRKVVDIPAATYGYTIADVESTSVFYLRVTAAQSPDTSFTFQASEYPITVDPAIMDFWSDSSFPPPGAKVTLNWKVSDTVVRGTVTCLQSGRLWDLDAAALARGTLPITTPAISMISEYVLEVFETPGGGGDAVAVASRTLQIQISPSIPRPSEQFGQFFTNEQAADLALPPGRPITDEVLPRLVAQIFRQFKTYYPDIDFYLDWSNPVVNAQSFVFFDQRKKVVLFGGLVRYPGIYYEGLSFIVAQCVSRLSGLAPATAQGLTYVGAADFYATSSVIREVFYAITNDSDLINGISMQIQALFNSVSTANQGGNDNDLQNDPAIGCRIVALQTGIFGGNVPKCAGGQGPP
jgi:hypothetical protein